MQKVLEIQNLSKSFNNRQILHKINFDVKEGEIFSLIGMNGIGKSTLIKMILDLLDQDEGEIKVFGKDKQDVEVKKKLVYLPEKFIPSIYLTGGEFVSFASSFYDTKNTQKDIEDMAEKLALDKETLSRRVSKYSKGMAQKLGLMSVFLPKVPLIILDEPMSGLDPYARILLKQQLKNYVKNSKRSIFFTSHILSDIEEICTRIAILHEGNIYYTGSVENFKKRCKAKTLEEAFLSLSIKAG